MSEQPIDYADFLVNRPHQFSYESGIRITRLEPGLCEGELTVGPNSLNPHGTVHGGALATLADTVSGCCACSRGGNCVTANSSMEFLRPAGGKRIRCRATPKKLGRILSVISFSMTDDLERTVATGTFTFYMLGERDDPARGIPQSAAEQSGG